jgi:hypothetical protein
MGKLEILTACVPLRQSSEAIRQGCDRDLLGILDREGYT